MTGGGDSGTRGGDSFAVGRRTLVESSAVGLSKFIVMHVVG